MRWKPSGNTCIRNRRMNSVVSSVITPYRSRPFESVILPFEGDALVIERDQATVGDGDAMGVAGETARDFRGSPEWAFAVDHPLTVAASSSSGTSLRSRRKSARM